ncbi:MAG: sugar phosphate nucleotidyltransferase, partial [Desulfurococcaceae archaeon]
MLRVVITAGGLGTRLLPVTKEIPKELLPLYSRGFNGLLFVKPILQIIFELLYSHGIREFCIVTGRGKRAVEDH